MENSAALFMPKKSTTVLIKEFLVKKGWSWASHVAPGAAARIFDQLFFTAQRHPVPVREQEILARGERLWVDVQEQRLAVWRWSFADRPYAPAVVLLHGWSGRAGQMTPFVEPLLQAGFAVWAFDGPGHGISSGRLTSGVALANALLALADQWGPPAGVIAHSIGGWAAVHAALLGAEFPKIVLISAPDNPADFLGQVADTLGLTEAAKLAAMKLAERRLGLRYHQIALSPRLGKLPSDALIVHDRQDREIPLHVGEKIAAHWPGARALWTEGLGHRRILRDPQVLGAVVRFFQEER